MKKRVCPGRRVKEIPAGPDGTGSTAPSTVRLVDTTSLSMNPGATARACTWCVPGPNGSGPGYGFHEARDAGRPVPYCTVMTAP